MNLRHTIIIFKREYTQRIRRPGFIIGTALGLIAIVALSFLPALFNLLDQQNVTKIAIIDPHNLIYSYLPSNADATIAPAVAGQGGAPISTSAGIKFSKADTSDPTALAKRVNSGALTAYVTVEGNTPTDVRFVYHSKDRPSPSSLGRLLGLLGGAATQARLSSRGITPDQAQQIFTPPGLNVVPIELGTLKDEKSYAQSALVVYGLLVLLYGTLIMYGVQVANGVVEEKSTRVMEVLINAVRPIELLMGKVLGIGLVAVTQYATWVGAGALVLLARTVLNGASGVASGVGSGLGSGSEINIEAVPATTLIFFPIFFVLGYILFAAMYAGLGSLVSKAEDVNSITTPLVLVMVANYLTAIWALGSPDADPVKWLSFLPIFTPMLMFIRVALSNPAPWEVILSIILLAATSFLFTWIAAKIYRIGVLLYGKRPSIREVTRLLRVS